MPNLTSTLTLKLTDDLSGPAKKAAESLKAIEKIVSITSGNRKVKNTVSPWRKYERTS